MSAIKLKVTKASGKYDLGRSKFLGSPVMPEWMVNEFDDETIFFLQLNLEEIKDLDNENLLPHTGYLYIFLDVSSTEYSLKPIIKYTTDEPTHSLDGFNDIVDGYEDFIDDYLIEFEECDDFSSGIKLFGKPNDWPFEKTDNRLFLQFDPLDSDMGIFNNLDGYIYFFFGKDNKTFKDIKIVEDVS